MKKCELQIGDRFGKLVILGEDPIRAKSNGGRKYICQCDCGEQKSVMSFHLIGGGSKSCGLCRRRMTSNCSTSSRRISSIYSGMICRCYNPNVTAYKNYGGRGIEICNEWREDFIIFHDWAIANGYEDHLSIDRIDVNGNYTAENCRWVNRKIQNRNKRDNVFLNIDGKQKTIAEWAEITGIRHHTIAARHRRGYTNKDLINPPNRTENRVFVEFEGKIRTIKELAQIAGISPESMNGRIKLGWTGLDLIQPLGYKRKKT